jgi:gliding motility-associated-like protein
MICPYDTLLLNGSASFAAPGHMLATYAWTVGDTTLVSSSPLLTLPVPAPGQFSISLTVSDEIGCASTNSSVALLRAGTRPDFTGTGIVPSTICAGETATLTGSAQGTLWSSVPQPIIAGLFLLPDGCPPPGTYTATLNVSGFPAGTTVNGSTDILDVCLNMEHSYLGDLSVSMSCPDGQSVLLFSGYGGGGGGTYLGSPLDNSTGVPGTGSEYCFSATAPWGTLVSENTAANYVTAGNPPGNSMAPGTYAPQQSFSQWDGCSLNGTWTITVTDNLCIDDGFIFDMSMDINPALYPNVIEFTPVVGQGCDSSYWSGPDLTSVSADCNTVGVTPSSSGTFPYTYTVTDDFGCTYDTTKTITVTPAVNFSLSTVPPNPCGNPVLLYTQLQLPLPTGALTYQWTPSAGLSSSTTPFPQASPTVPTWYQLHAYPAGHPLCGMVDSVLVNPLTTLQLDSLVGNHLCHGDSLGYIEAVTTGTGGPWDYVWTDEAGTIIQSTSGATGDTLFANGGTYQVHVVEGPNGNGCQDSLVAIIDEPLLLEIPSISADTTICLTGMADLIAVPAGGTSPIDLHWDHGLAGNAPQSVAPAITTTYSVYATDINNCFSDTQAVTVNVLPPLHLELPDTIDICPKVDLILAPDSVSGGNAQWTYDWGHGPFLDPDLIVNLFSTHTFCLTLRDGCETPPVTRCVVANVTPVPPLVLTADSVLGCEPFLVHFSIEDTSGQATVDWDFGDGAAYTDLATAVAHSYGHYGNYTVTVNAHWPVGCSYDSTYEDLITVIDIPHLDFSWAPDPANIFENQVQFHELADELAISYQWDFAGLGSSSLPDPSFIFPNAIGTTYPVELLVRNFLGCPDSVTRFIEVQDEFLVYIPTAFTPDNDGLNDILQVRGNDIAPNDFHLTVFDRWGHEVFDTTDPHQGWDGKMNGKVVKNGVYTWMLRAQSAYTGVNHDLQGQVTVVD